ncbi:MAG: hypothetical protein HKN03_06490 [Acidimicrobiales bacterium]|nr:hypothetical protein [Acidimicrobiales bacterium]
MTTIALGSRLAGMVPQRSMVSSALGMVGGKASAMFLGFAFWLAAANLASPGSVGLAAAATSTIMLVVLVASSGVAAAVVIGLAERTRTEANRFLDTALTATTVLALLVSGLALLLALLFLDELDAVARSGWFAALFCAMGVLGSLGVVLDQVSMSDRRGSDVLVRNVANGVVTIVPLALVWAGWVTGSAPVLFAAWVGGSATAVILAIRHTRRIFPGSARRPLIHRASARSLVGHGLGNQLLTSAERMPGLVLPIIVTEVLSPAENAFWYATWMMAWGVAVVPLSIGTALFAEVCREPSRKAPAIRQAVRSSLMLVVPLAVAVGLVAPLLLSLLGDEYSDAGASPLRFLVLGALPLTFIYAYFAVARATSHLREAILTALLGGGVGVITATLFGSGAFGSGGLTPMAAAWVTIQFITGLWALWRLKVLSSSAPVLATATTVGVTA